MTNPRPAHPPRRVLLSGRPRRLFRLPLVLLLALAAGRVWPQAPAAPPAAGNAVSVVESYRAGNAVKLAYAWVPGSRRTLKESFSRHFSSSKVDFTVTGEFTASLGVTGTWKGLATMALQRDRKEAKVVNSVVDGRNRTEEDQKANAERLRTLPASFAEANRCDAAGNALLPWSATREWTSETLPLTPEIIPLPSRPLRQGDSWNAGPMALQCTALGVEECQGVPCVKIAVSYGQGGITGTVLFDPQEGFPRRHDFAYRYETAFGKVNEKWTVTLADIVRGEQPEHWLKSGPLAHGVIASYQLAGLPLPDSVRALLLQRLAATPGDRDVATLLSLFYRKRLDPPPADLLEKLFGSVSPRVRCLCVRLLSAAEPRERETVLLRAAQDPDFFVRRAAEEARNGPAAGAAASPEDVTALPPGTFLEPLDAAPFAGWPYVVRIPEDYRGDRPFPLLVFLSGGDGRALVGAQSCKAALRETGFLAVFPQSVGMWWEADSTRMLIALIEEIKKKYNIDRNRVYLAGFSNGATAILSSAGRYPHLFAAAASLNGAGVGGPPGYGLLSNLSALPLLFVSGEKDAVLPPWATRKTVEALREFPRTAPLEMKVFPDFGHDLILGQKNDPTFPFLLAQVRNPFPEALDFRLRGRDYPRHYWLEVLSLTGAEGRVQASVDEHRNIVLHTSGIGRLRLRLGGGRLSGAEPLQVTADGRVLFSGPPPAASHQSGEDPAYADAPILDLDLAQ